jgi:hypothetical protein
MNGKLISTENFDPVNILLKPPSGGYSEIWYKDGGCAVRPIFKTPRLPVKFSAKRYNEQTAYSYCLNMSNKDIDSEIGAFFQFVKQVDRALINAFTESNKSWSVKPTTCLKYRTAMKRRTTQDDFYFQLKLVHSIKGGPPTTVIYNRKGTAGVHERENVMKVGPEEITYGKYADQFICPAYLYYDDQGIHPVWQAQQIVLSSVERVFLEECILDHIFGPVKIQLQRQLQSVQSKQLAHVVVHDKDNAPANPLHRPRLTIDPMELKNVIKSLKPKPINSTADYDSSDD